jgi:hypothetical protein
MSSLPPFTNNEELDTFLADVHSMLSQKFAISEGDLVAAIDAHVAEVDPHTQYHTAAEVAADIAAHVAASDPHGDRAFALAADAAHVAAADPHIQYPLNNGTRATGTWGVSITGSAATLTTGRTLSATGDATGTSGSFNGSANFSIPLTLATVNASPQTDQLRKITVNGKGLVTATSAVADTDIAALVDARYVRKVGDTLSGSLSMSSTWTVFYSVEVAGVTNVPVFLGSRARGDLSSKTAVLNNDAILDVRGYGHGATTYGEWGGVRIFATENHTDAAKGTGVALRVITNGGTTQISALAASGSGLTAAVPYLATSGSVAAPGYAFVSASSTGYYLSGGTIRTAIAGVDIAVTDATGLMVNTTTRVNGSAGGARTLVNGLNCYMAYYTGSDANPAIMTLAKRRTVGDFAVNGDGVGQLRFEVWNGASLSPHAQITAVADENHSGSVRGTYLRFDATLAGTTTQSTVAAIYGDRLQMLSSARIYNTGGTAALPSYTFTGDTGLGISRLSAGILGISAAGAEVARFSSSGIQLSTVMSMGGSTSSTVRLLIVGNGGTGTATRAIQSTETIQSNTTGTYYTFSSAPSTAAAAFTLDTLSHYFAAQGTIGAGSAVTTQVGFYVNANMTGATNNQAFRGSLASAAGVYNLFMDGTANNFLNGNLGIKNNAPAYELDVAGTISSSSMQVVGSTGTLGYAAGSGGSVTQLTSRTTGVTLNKATGSITLFSAAGSTTPTSFTVTNSTVGINDTIIVNQRSGTDLYQAFVTAVAAGSFRITFFTTGGTTTEQPVFNFTVVKGAVT